MAPWGSAPLRRLLLGPDANGGSVLLFQIPPVSDSGPLQIHTSTDLVQIILCLSLSKQVVADMSYLKEFKESIDQPERFWKRQAEKIHWFSSPESILSHDENDFYRWFKGEENQ